MIRAEDLSKSFSLNANLKAFRRYNARRKLMAAARTVRVWEGGGIEVKKGRSGESQGQEEGEVAYGPTIVLLPLNPDVICRSIFGISD